MSAHNRAVLATARGQIDNQAAPFRAFEAWALELDRAGDTLGAVAATQIAFEQGTRNHPGLLAGPALEELVNRAGREHVGERHAPRRPDGEPERVLHVFTETYPTGGHTRLGLRWIESDTERRSTVVLTRQREPLPDAVRDCGAELVEGLPGDDLLARARALRALAAEHDLVVLHVHMQDVVPALAFAEPDGRPPVVFVDHADHVMWIGSAAADVIAGYRDAGGELAVTRRGFDAGRWRLLPIPVPSRPLPDRAAARAQLGIDPDTPVLLTVASGYKIQPVLEPSFAEVALAALAADPRAILLAVGPTALAAGERAHALGPVPDIAPHLAAADVYLDSWPASSCTSVLEAGAAGLPILAVGAEGDDLAMLQPREAALRDGVAWAWTPEEVTARTAELLAGGPNAAQAVRDGHTGEGWAAQREAVVAAAREHAGAARPPAPVAPAPVTDWEAVIHLLRTAEGHGCTPLQSYAIHCGDLPAPLRPYDIGDAQRRVEEILESAPETGRRAVAAPALDAAAVHAAVDRLRALVAAGEVAACVVAVPEERLDEGLVLLEQALAAGTDIDLDVVPTHDVTTVARPGDFVVA